MNDLTIIQNFVCTQKERLSMIEQELPKMSKIFKDTSFIINYNSKKNLEKIKKLYVENIEKDRLIFKNDLRQNFAKTTKDLLSLVETEYVMFICEDFVYLENREEWCKVFNEIKIENIDFCMLAKIEKYARPEWHAKYTTGESIYKYDSKNSPTNRGVISIDAIYKTEKLFEKISSLEGVRKIEMNDGRISEYVNMPNFYEQYYVDDRGMTSTDWKCCLPKKLITYSYHPQNKAERPW